MELERPLPAPITPETRPFWDGLKEGKLLLPRCDDTGQVFFYPRAVSPFTHSRNISWVEASGKGTLYSFEILHRAFVREVKTPCPTSWPWYSSRRDRACCPTSSTSSPTRRSFVATCRWKWCSTS